MVPTTMSFVRAERAGDADVLVMDQGPTPQPGRGEVLIRVEAAGINRADILQRQGRYPPPPGAPAVLGLEVAGTVVGIGAGAEGWREGDAVCALVAGGGYAEYCVAPAAHCLPLPAGLDGVRSAAVPEGVFTVWNNVVARGRLRAGEWFLVHGGAGGIGSFAIQIAVARGAKVVATAGGADKAAFCAGLGAHHVIDYTCEDFVERVRALTGKAGIDVILDMVGGDYVQRNLRCLAMEGRLVQIAFQQGSRMALDLAPLLTRRLTLTGSTLRPLSCAEKASIAEDVRREIWPLFERGALAVHVDRTFPIGEAAAAHAWMESGAHKGKIVLTMR